MTDPVPRAAPCCNSLTIRTIDFKTYSWMSLTEFDWPVLIGISVDPSSSLFFLALVVGLRDWFDWPVFGRLGLSSSTSGRGNRGGGCGFGFAWLATDLLLSPERA